MPAKKLRIYADTSVFGGCHDEEFERDSLEFISALRSKQFVLLISEIVLRGLEKAPPKVIAVLESIPPETVESIDLTDEVLELRDAYIEEGILTPRWSDDAAHVAAATVARADAIVSWNFSHIVRLDKMKAYNRVNLREGYGILTIITPKEVVFDGGEE